METFCESPRFDGTCYRAANWIKVGRTQGRGKLDVRNEHALPVKDIWLKPRGLEANPERVGHPATERLRIVCVGKCIEDANLNRNNTPGLQKRRRGIVTPSKRDLRTPPVMRGPDPNRAYVLEAHPCRFPRTPCSLPGRRVPIRNRNSEGRVTRAIFRRPKWTAASRLTTTPLPPQGKRNLVVAINSEAQRRQWATSVKRAGMGRRVSQGAEAVGPVSTELQPPINSEAQHGLSAIPVVRTVSGGLR